MRASGKEIALTGIEYELLLLLMRSPGRVFTRPQLIAQVAGFQRSSPLDRAVDIHISNVRRKLRLAVGYAIPIESVRGVGYRLAVAEPLERAPAGSSAGELRLALLLTFCVPTPHSWS